MTLRNADRDSARVTAVMYALSRVRLQAPTVDWVEVEGEEAVVRLRGSEGQAAELRLRKRAGRWRVVEGFAGGGEHAA